MRHSTFRANGRPRAPTVYHRPNFTLVVELDSENVLQHDSEIPRDRYHSRPNLDVVVAEVRINAHAHGLVPGGRVTDLIPNELVVRIVLIGIIGQLALVEVNRT